jgi:WD40 repeat protein
MSDDGTRIAISARGEGRVTIWEANQPAGNGTPWRVSDATQQIEIKWPTVLAFPPDGTSLIGVIGEDTFTAWGLADLKQSWRWSNEDFIKLLGRGEILSLAVGRRQALGGTAASQVIRLVPGANDYRMWKASSAVTSLAITADEATAFVGTADGKILRLRLPAGSELEQIGAHTDAVTSLVLAERDQLLATASRDKTIQLWKLRDGSVDKLITLRASGPIDRLRVTADGSRLIGHIQGESALRVWRPDLLRERLREMELDW